MPITKIEQNEINKAIWSTCDVFRSTIDPFIYKDYILTMLFLRYISDVNKDKVTELKKLSFKIPSGCSFWDLFDLRCETGNGIRINTALHAIEEANTKLKGVFQGINFNSDKLGDETQKNDVLQHLLKDFGKDTLDLRPSNIGTLDIIGNAYEYLIKYFASVSSKSADEFYTPEEVSDLLAILLNPQENNTICDPACGSGSLLLKFGKQIQKNFNGSKKYALFGQEASSSTWSLAKMNMFLHSEDNHRIECGDTIRNPKLQDANGELLYFDIATANLSLSHDNWGYGDAENDHFGRFHRGIPPKTKDDYAYISHMIETLKPDTGRMGVVVQHGVLFRGSNEGVIRQNLIEENLLDAVIGLPANLFFGTNIPAAILIFKKNKVDKNVIFIDASREFKANRNQNQLTEGNIHKIVETYRNGKNVEKYAYLASIEEIRKNDYNLNIPRYVDTFEEEVETDLLAVRQEGLALQAELVALEAEMDGYLKELGYSFSIW